MLTIAIVTHKRPYKLSRCLESILNQTTPPEKIIIVDNDVDELAKRTYMEYSSKLPLEYYTEPNHCTPRARNQAIKNCSTALCAFIDDDCILDEHWVENGLKAIQNPNAAFIAGNSLLLNEHNIIAQAQFQTYIEWFYNNLDETNIVNPKNLDTKNVILKIDLIKKNNIKFDTQFYLDDFSAGEDVDLGMQLSQLGLNGYFASDMILYHEETESFKHFVKKAFMRGQISYLLYKKWHSKNKLIEMGIHKSYYWIFNIWRWPFQISKIKSGNFFTKTQILFLIKIYDRAHLLGFLREKRKEQKL